MIKILSLYQRNYDGDRLVRNEVVAGAEWVLAGEGVPTRKFDGTPCMVRDGVLYKRYDAKHGKTPPPDFEPAQPEPDPVSGHWPGWRPVGMGPEDALLREATVKMPPDGTYELCGPKVNKNPEGFETHVLVRHGAEVLKDVPLTFEGIKLYLAEASIEGIVWHHPDGRMVKIKARDFGIKRRGYATRWEMEPPPVSTRFRTLEDEWVKGADGQPIRIIKNIEIIDIRVG